MSERLHASALIDYEIDRIDALKRWHKARNAERRAVIRKLIAECRKARAANVRQLKRA